MEFGKVAVIGTIALALLCGCGGGSGSGGSTSTTIKIGEASVTYQGSPVKPFVEAGQGAVTVTGMAGAAYSNIGLVPNQNLDNSLICLGGYGDLITETLSGVQNVIAPPGVAPVYGVFTHDRHIVFLGVGLSDNEPYIYECNYDGTNLQKVLTNPVGSESTMAWSPNDQKMAWVDTSANLWVSNTDGSDAVLMGAGGAYPSFSPDGTTLVFLGTNGGGYTQLYTEPISGGTPTAISGQSSTTNYEFPSFMNSDEEVMCTVAGTSSESIAFFATAGGSVGDLSEPSIDTYQYQSCLGPDGKTLVFMNGPTGGPDTPTIALATGADSTPLPDPGNVLFPQWSPYYSSQTFVGNGGSMTTSSAGFLWGQQGDGFSSFLTFTASNPSSATITAETPSGSGALVFDIHASAISTLKYTNGYYFSIYGVNPNSGTTDILVSFDSTSGQVETVAPFVEARTATKPLQQAGSLVFKARFSAVYDAKGNNLAVNGASKVALDVKSGKVVGLADSTGDPITVPSVIKSRSAPSRAALEVVAKLLKAAK